ncbi:hypothetical protein IU448_22205 [Nocardia flavorosea]|uniref:hypothetical protein n=1 Tax=Nocardia flavorosea TaxID=53429 RepID=UPI001894F848|nr:hypothetical protein [Nocardia flavorosea]MBF6351706.1 hypothetical protein [Nocardia flavorosea]
MTDSALVAMAAMVGEWKTTSEQIPDMVGRTTIEWLDGDAFLLVRLTVPEPAIDRIWVVGTDDAYPERLKVLQHDGAGARRIYNGALTGPLWRIWRDAPGDSQRLTGNLDETGNIFRATWERSDAELDPRTWEHQMDIVYTRIA